MTHSQQTQLDLPQASSTLSSCPALTPLFAVSLVSHSRLLYEGLAAILPNYINIHFAEYYDSEHGLVATPQLDHHIALLDGTLDQQTLSPWIRHWRKLDPPTAVVVIEVDDCVERILQCIEAGANAYSVRGASAKELADTIWRTGQGITVCSPEITAHLFARLACRTPDEFTTTAPLTPREREVLQLIAQHCSNQEIANRLVIEVRTVKHHVHNILNKLKMSDRWQAADFAKEQGWLQTA